MTPPREPAAPDPSWLRYSRGPFPRYRYIPGRSPHPRRHPEGHSYGWPELRAAVDPADWAGSEVYLRGVDLFNFAYWWESHEVFEALWHGAGRQGAAGAFFQGLVQLGAAEIKRFSGAESAARALGERALGRLAGVPSAYMGVDVRGLEGEVRARVAGERGVPVLITLAVPAAP